MLQIRDDIHLKIRPFMGYNKALNFICSPREPGKSTVLWNDLFYNSFSKRKECMIILVRTANSVTEGYITSIEDIIHKFSDESFKFIYNRGGLGKEGIFDLYAMIGEKKYRAIRFIAYTTPIDRIKRTLITNISYMGFDEFICNPKWGEKYSPSEYEKFQEIYSTYVREKPNLQCWFFGNPYSMYNPYFIGLKVDTKQCYIEDEKTRTLTGELYAIHFVGLSKELKEHILKNNPLYNFDDSYAGYAVKGQAVNDSNIKVGVIKNNYQLVSFFHIQGKYLSIYMNMKYDENEEFYVGIADEIGKRQNVFCFDVEDLVNQSVLIDRTEALRFRRLKNAFRTRDIVYQSIECYYLIEAIFSQL